MTHSLHRRGDYECLKDDFVVLGCPATGVNKIGSAPKTQKYLSIAYKCGPINLGDMKTGNIHNTTMADILNRVTDGTIVQCTFDNRDKIVTLLRELKNDRPGISVSRTRHHSFPGIFPGHLGPYRDAAGFPHPENSDHVRPRHDRFRPGAQNGAGRQTRPPDRSGLRQGDGGMLLLRKLQPDPRGANFPGLDAPVHGSQSLLNT